MFFYPFMIRGSWGSLGEDITLLTPSTWENHRIFMLVILGASSHARLDTFPVIPLRNYTLSSGSKVNKHKPIY